MKTQALSFTAAALLCAVVSCNKTELQNIEPKNAAGQHRSSQLMVPDERGAKQLSELEHANIYFDYHKYEMQLKFVIDEPTFSTPSFKVEPGNLYVYDVHTGVGWPGNVFTPVSSASIAAGDIMLWKKMTIQFMAGHTPHQFYSASDVEAAARGIHPEITLGSTGQVYQGTLLTLGKNRAPESIGLTSE